MTEELSPTAPGARWSYRRVLTGPGPHGHLVEIVTGVVDTPDGPAPALLVGVGAVVLDETLTSALIIDLLRAKRCAGIEREEGRR